MKTKIRHLFPILLLVITIPIKAQIDLTVQKKWECKKVFLSALYKKQISNSRHGIEAGINFTPATTKDFSEFPSDTNKYEFDSYYGLVTGYYFGILPWLRTGVHFGVGYKREQRFTKTTETYLFNGYKDWKMSPYAGIGIQISIVSFIFSNEGIGGGINFTFGGDR